MFEISTDTPQEETDFLFLSRYQLQMDSWFGYDSLCISFLFSVQVLCVQSQFLWVHKCISFAVEKRHCFLGPSTLSGSSNISTSSWHVSLSPESKDWIETFCQSLSTSGIVQLWVSVLTTIYCNKILPRWVLSKALDHGYTSMSFRSHVITMFL